MSNRESRVQVSGVIDRGNTMSDIYLLSEGREDGPYSEEEIQQALAWGFIPSDLLAWREGLHGWIQVGKLLGMPEEITPWRLV